MVEIKYPKVNKILSAYQYFSASGAHHGTYKYRDGEYCEGWKENRAQAFEGRIYLDKKGDEIS